MRLPSIDIKTIFVVGFYAFGIQGIANIFLFFINIHNHNIFSGSITWGTIIFAFVLAYFFYYSYKSMSGSSVPGGVGFIDTGEELEEVDEDTLKLINDLKKVGE